MGDGVDLRNHKTGIIIILASLLLAALPAVLCCPLCFRFKKIKTPRGVTRQRITVGKDNFYFLQVLVTVKAHNYLFKQFLS